MRAPPRASGELRALVARFRATSRLVQIAVLMLVIATVWYPIALVRPAGPSVWLWTPTVVGAVVVTLAFRRASRIANLPATTRRFWRHLTITAVLVASGCTNQPIEVLRHPGGLMPPINPVILACFGSAILTIIFALQRLPLSQQTRGEALRVGLDAGTVMLASGVYVWYFFTRATTPSSGTLVTFSYLMLTILVSFAVLVMVKVVLSSPATLDKSALRLLALCMGVAALGSQVIDLLAPNAYLTGSQVSNPAAFVLAVLAAERQRVAALGPRPTKPRGRRRPFSVLPYIAVAAVDALLIAVTWSSTGVERLIVAAAVGLTALVVLRQMTAFRDNTRLLAELDHSATHDALTQLPNRTLFGQRLDEALTGPEGHPVQVALIDLDGFKKVNDTLGHEIGDLLLVAVARRLSGCMRTQDTAARLGGDEFVVVLDGADRAGADAAARRIVDAFRPPVIANGHELPIRCSIGIAGGRTGDEANVVMRHADAAMYAAKKLTGTAYLHHDDVIADHPELVVELPPAEAEQELLRLMSGDGPPMK